MIHNTDLWQEVYTHHMKEGRDHKECIQFADEVAGPRPGPEKPEPPRDEGKYYRTGRGVYVRVTGAKTFDKAAWLKGVFSLSQEQLELKTCEEIFSRKPWKPTTRAKWDEVFEPLAKTGTGTRSAKPMEFVFECGGIKYFKYRDDLDMPEGRRREMEAVWLEYSAQADREYLQGIPAAILACIDHNPVKLTEIAQLARDMDQRLKMTFDFGLYEKLASVLYFDMEEDTSRWDVAYNNQKIANWREHGGMDFFLSMPIKEFLPSEILSRADSSIFLQREKIKVELLRARMGEVFRRLSIEPTGNSSGKRK